MKHSIVPTYIFYFTHKLLEIQFQVFTNIDFRNHIHYVIYIRKK